MAREEDDREDLLREATGLVDRVEILADFCGDPIFVGFRRNAAASLFFGQAEVYQFNALDQLRRVYLSGQLLKAEHGRLVALTRERTGDQTFLVRHPYDDQQTADLLRRLTQRLDDLRDVLWTSQFELRGVVSSSGSDVIDRTSRWLADLQTKIEIASDARVNRSK